MSDIRIILKTSKGNIEATFFASKVPMTTASFLNLAKRGYYDGIKFHRVITKFMAQGGDPNTLDANPANDGQGGPGYQFDGELSPKVKHDRPGMLSMANAGPGTDGSQFFLTFVPTPWLDGKHTIFGEVIEGLDVLAKLESHGSKQGSTTKVMTIDKCTVEVR